MSTFVSNSLPQPEDFVPTPIDATALLSGGLPGGLDISSFALSAFAQAVTLFDTIVSFNLPAIPAIRDFAEPVFGGGIFTIGAVPTPPPDPVIPGLAPITAPQFAGGSYFLPVPPPAPVDLSAPAIPQTAVPQFTGTAFTTPAFDGVTPGTVTFPASPAAPALASITADPVDPAPPFTAVKPAVQIPLPPADFIKAVPLIDTLAPVVVPPEPDSTLPTSPTLEQITLPASPTIINPTFDAVLVGSPADPTALFSFTQTAFSDSLLTAVKSKLDFWLDDNQTGLADSIYQAMWDRAKEREDALGLQARDDAFEEFAARGFSLPPGALVARTQEIIQGNQDKSSSLLREQTIKQADMEVENVRFAITEASRLEIVLIDNHLQTERLGFDIARASVELAISVFDAQVNRYNADVSAFRTQAEVFKTLLEGEVLKLDVFRAELEGERIKGEINTQKIDNYRAQIEAVLATFELFKSRLEAARFTIDSNKLLIEKFQAEIEGFATEARAAAIATDIYSSKINAEGLKIQTFASEVDAFEAQVSAYNALITAKSTAKDQEIRVEQFKIESFRADIEAVRAQIDALTAQLNSETAVFDSQVRKFGSEADAEARRVGADVDQFRGEVDAFSAATNSDVSRAQIIVDTARVNNDKFGSRVSAFAASVGGESSRFTGEIDKHRADIQGFEAESRREVDTARIIVDQSNAVAAIYDAKIRGFVGETQAESARYGAEADVFRAEVQSFTAKSTRDVEAARVKVEELVGQLNLLSERVIAGARIAGQLGSAALATFNFSNVVSNSHSHSSANTYARSFSSQHGIFQNDSVSNTEIRTCPC